MNPNAAFKKKIWSYYHSEGRKLPWRETLNPYRILVSEIMLQQTQVSRVLVKYPQFLAEFPNFRALATAPVPTVLTAWQGMGYNRRALALKNLAQIVVRDYKGKLPERFEDLLALPGIGKGTAGSLSAFVFNRPVPFIETNIRRVYIHFFFPLHEGVSDKELFPLIEKTIDRKNPREWYYALMDYGAMLGRTAKFENPNIRSKHYRPQSKFEGSKRQLRGKILKTLLTEGTMTDGVLVKRLGKTANTLKTVVSELIAERFVRRSGGKLAIAE